MITYRTFIRSARNFEEFASAEKREVETGLLYSEAADRCREYNANRSMAEVERGTKMEFESED